VPLTLDGSVKCLNDRYVFWVTASFPSHMRPTASSLEKEGHAVRGKRQRLAASGTRNFTPEKVQDRLFQSYDFFDPEDLVQVK
jgi:hypothetical protein